MGLCTPALAWRVRAGVHASSALFSVPNQAAETELANTASVRLLMAAEEEVKARAAVRRGAYSGPLLRYHSLRVDDESVVRCSLEPLFPAVNK